MSNNTTLTEGYYLGIRRSTRNFSFTLPKIGRKEIPTDMDTWFNQLNSGKKVTNSNNRTMPGSDEKSTSFSGWFATGNPEAISSKGIAAPIIYKSASGEDPEIALNKVKTFKQNAAKVLDRCCKEGTPLTEAVASEINQFACCVQEIKVVILCVSAQERNGFRHDPNTDMWYFEKTLRKFYLLNIPKDSLLRTFAEELADPTTSINAEQELVVVRNDGVKSNARSSFRVVRVTKDDDNWDETLFNAVQRIQSKLMQLSFQ